MKGEPKFIRNLRNAGCRARVVRIEHLEELGAEIGSLHDKGLVDDPVFRAYEKPYFTPELPRHFRDAKSIVVAAAPSPMLHVTFKHEGEAVRLVVPPHYFDYRKVMWRARRLLADAFRPESYRLARAILPVKLLAVRSGLAMYGKNNITYIPEFGSFHRLVAFYTNYVTPTDQWQEKKVLPKCSKCKACTRACPTGAIQGDRFVIRAGKCLTYHNEMNSECEFPKWISASAHNSLVGCVRCQLACPYNKGVANWYEDRGRFTEEETEYLLAGKFSGIKAERIGAKLKNVGLNLALFPRNLEVLLNREDKQTLL